MANKHQISQRTAITPSGGTRIYSRLINGVRTYGVAFHARATVTLTVADATLLRNRGSVFSLFDEIGIEENGRDRHLYDGRMLRFMSEMHAPSALTATRAAVGVAVYAIEETAIIWFGHPLSAAPQETVFREADARQLLQAFVRLVADPGAVLNGRLYTLGPATVVISAITVDVTQIYDSRSAELPVFIPTFRQMSQSVAATNTQDAVFIKTPHFIRALIIQQDTDEGEVSDIITGIALRGDFRDIIGPTQMSMDTFQFIQELDFGGLVLSNQAYLGLNFQRGGKLSNVINPSDDVNLRFEFSDAVSATGASSIIRIGIVELERVAGLVRSEIPFPI